MQNLQIDSKKLVVLIDADNTSPSIIEGLLQEVAKFGIATVKRIYGDWTSPNLKGWKTVLLLHAIQPIQQFGYTSGKNSTDSAMIIDAMDLLYTNKFDVFCIVSSDSDFTRLASRIRESGAMVYGFGEKKTPKPFISACDKFVYTEILSDNTADDGTESTKTKSKKKKEPLTADKKLMSMLRSAVAATVDESGWAYLAAVGVHIANHSPEFDPRNYGYNKLNDLIRAVDQFKVYERPDANDPKIKQIFVQEKNFSPD